MNGELKMFESNNRVTLLCRSDFEIVNQLSAKLFSKKKTFDNLLTKFRAAKVVEDHLCPEDLVRVGTGITLKDLGTATVVKMVLTDGKARQDSNDDEIAKVSVRSSLGIAVLGMRKGDDIKWTLPNGHVRYLRIAELTNRSQKAYSRLA